MNELRVPWQPKNSVLMDGKHDPGKGVGPLSIAAGKPSRIRFEVRANQGLSWLTLHRELSGGSGDLSGLSVMLVDANDVPIDVATERELGSNDRICPYADKTLSRVVNDLAPGEYSYLVYDRNGKPHSNLVFAMYTSMVN